MSEIKDINGQVLNLNDENIKIGSLGVSLKDAILQRLIPIPIGTEKQIEDMAEKIAIAVGTISSVVVNIATDDTGTPHADGIYDDGVLNITLYNIKGEQGEQGVQGESGKSAYQEAVDKGYVGTEEEWLESLRGADGKDGENGSDGYTPVKGVDYFDGKDGKDGTITNLEQTLNPSTTSNAPSSKAVAEYVSTHGGTNIKQGENIVLEPQTDGSIKISAHLPEGTATTADKVAYKDTNVAAKLDELEQQGAGDGYVSLFRREDITFEYGKFTSGRANVKTPTTLEIRDANNGIRPSLANGHLLIRVKNGYELTLADYEWDGIDFVKNGDGSYKNKLLTYMSGITYLIEDDRKIRIGAKKVDDAEISAEEVGSILEVYEFVPHKHEYYDYTIAASDSPKYMKDKADIVCDGTNDQWLLQGLISNGQRRVCKLLLYTGKYWMSEVRQVRKWMGNKFFLICDNAGWSKLDRIKSFQIDGYQRGVVQYASGNGSEIHIKRECWDSIEDFSTEEISVLRCSSDNMSTSGTAYGQKQNTFINMQFITMFGYDHKKPIVYFDLSNFRNLMIDRCNVHSKEGQTFEPFDCVPNPHNIGFKLLHGDPYGNHYVKHALAWGCGVGYSLSGEHFILMDAVSCFCGTAYYWGGYWTKANTQHSNMMLKCASSQCMKSIVFGRYGLPEDTSNIDNQWFIDNFGHNATVWNGSTWVQLTDEQLAADPNGCQKKIQDGIYKLTHQRQQIEILAMDCEEIFRTKGCPGYDDGSHDTLGFYEEHEGCWGGYAYVEFFSKPVAKGCQNIIVRSLNVDIKGSATTLPVQGVSDYNTYMRNDELWIRVNGRWRQVQFVK